MILRSLLVIMMLFTFTACSSTDDEVTDGMTYGAGQGTDPLAGTETYGNTAGAVGAGTQEDLVANIGDRVFFGYDRYDLTAEARATLDRQAQWLGQYQNLSITIEGHADERGTREYNLALGEKRANAVRSYLVGAGVDGSRLNVLSYGKERPSVADPSPEGWAQNRRSVTVVN